MQSDFVSFIEFLRSVLHFSSLSVCAAFFPWLFHASKLHRWEWKNDTRGEHTTNECIKYKSGASVYLCPQKSVQIKTMSKSNKSKTICTLISVKWRNVLEFPLERRTAMSLFPLFSINISLPYRKYEIENTNVWKLNSRCNTNRVSYLYILVIVQTICTGHIENRSWWALNLSSEIPCKELV